MAILKKKITKTPKKPAKKKASKSSSKKLTALQKMELVLGKTKNLVVKDMKINLDIDSLKVPLAHLPTGSLIIDHLIGGTKNKYGICPCPGFPRGKFTQISGPNSCGKTTLALTASAITCAAGGTVLYIDLENEIDPTYAAHLGVPIGQDEKFSIYAPNTLEEVIGLMMIATTLAVDLIIIDSVGAGITKETYDMSAEDIAKGTTGRLGQVAAAWARGLVLLKSRVARSGTSVVGISQLRSGGPGSREFVIQGGKAWEFFTAVRIKLSRINWDYSKEYNAVTHKTDDKVKTSSIIRAELSKCKVSRNQGKKLDFYIKHGHGIDDHHSVFDIAFSHGLITKSGNYYSWDSHRFLKTKALEFLMGDPDAFYSLYNKVVPFLNDSQLSDGEEEEQDELDFDPDAMVEGLGLEDVGAITATLMAGERVPDGSEDPEDEEAEELGEEFEEEIGNLANTLDGMMTASEKDFNEKEEV